MNLRRFLEQQQSAGCEALQELSGSLKQILDIFGPDIAFNVTTGTAQRMLLKWLREQKAADAVAFTHAEVQEFRTILEMIPMIRAQLHAIGMELRDVTARLEKPRPARPERRLPVSRGSGEPASAEGDLFSSNFKAHGMNAEPFTGSAFLCRCPPAVKRPSVAHDN